MDPHMHQPNTFSLIIIIVIIKHVQFQSQSQIRIQYPFSADKNWTPNKIESESNQTHLFFSLSTLTKPPIFTLFYCHQFHSLHVTTNFFFFFFGLNQDLITRLIDYHTNKIFKGFSSFSHFISDDRIKKDNICLREWTKKKRSQNNIYKQQYNLPISPKNIKKKEIGKPNRKTCKHFSVIGFCHL